MCLPVNRTSMDACRTRRKLARCVDDSSVEYFKTQLEYMEFNLRLSKTSNLKT